MSTVRSEIDGTLEGGEGGGFPERGEQGVRITAH